MNDIFIARSSYTLLDIFLVNEELIECFIKYIGVMFETVRSLTLSSPYPHLILTSSSPRPHFILTSSSRIYVPALDMSRLSFLLLPRVRVQRKGVEDRAWLVRDFLASQAEAGAWVDENADTMTATKAVTVAQKTITQFILAALDSGINAAIIECCT